MCQTNTNLFFRGCPLFLCSRHVVPFIYYYYWSTVSTHTHTPHIHRPVVFVFATKVDLSLQRRNFNRMKEMRKHSSHVRTIDLNYLFFFLSHFSDIELSDHSESQYFGHGNRINDFHYDGNGIIPVYNDNCPKLV